MRARVASAPALSANGRARHTALHAAANPRSGTWHARPRRLSNQLRGGCHIYPSRGPPQPVRRRSLRPGTRSTSRSSLLPAEGPLSAALSSRPRSSRPGSPQAAVLGPCSALAALVSSRCSSGRVLHSRSHLGAVLFTPLSAQRTSQAALFSPRSPSGRAHLSAAISSPRRLSGRAPHGCAPHGCAHLSAAVSSRRRLFGRAPHGCAHIGAAVSTPRRRSGRAPHGCAYLSAAVFVAAISSRPVSALGAVRLVARGLAIDDEPR